MKTKTHLSQTQIQNILRGETGELNLAQALIHIEQCSICREKMPKLKEKEFVTLFLTDPEPNQQNNFPVSSQNKISFSLWNWKKSVLPISFAVFLLLFLGGVLFWISNKNKANSDQISLSNKELSNSPNSRTDFANQADTVVDTSVKTNSNINLKTNAPPSPNQTPIAPKQISKPKENDQPETNLNSLDNRELALNLEKNPAPLKELESPGITLRNNGGANPIFFAKYPIGEVVLETQPILKWSSVKNAVLYQVTVYDKNYNEIFTKELPQTEYKVPQPLQRGVTYLWQVVAKTDDNSGFSKITLPPLMFRVSDANTTKQVEKLNNSKQWEKVSLLFRAGLLNETEKQLYSILRKNPRDKSALKMLKRIKTLRNRNQRPPIVTKPAQ